MVKHGSICKIGSTMPRMKQWAAITTVCLTSVGCTSELTVFTESVETVTAADFSSRDSKVQAGGVTSFPVNERVPADQLALIDDGAQVEGMVIERSLLTPTRVNSFVIVESLVGQVNGRPIFANDVLGPIEDQLMILSEETRLDITAFKNVAKVHITDQMQTIVKSELLLSEAKSGMTKAQKQGLFSYLQKVREDLASSTGGSQSVVTRKLMDEEGKTVDEYLDYKQQQVLIQQLLREKVAPHIQVTWRDIERAWEQNKSSFTSPGKVTLGMIRVSSDEAEEMVELVKQSFAGGSSFKTVAAELGIPDGGIWDTFEIGTGGIAEIDVSATIMKHIEYLDEGEVVGPIQIGASQYWFTVFELDEPVVGTIWNPQTQIRLREYLIGTRSVIEETRFLERILADGSYDEFNAMVERILRVAVTRYAQ